MSNDTCKLCGGETAENGECADPNACIRKQNELLISSFSSVKQKADLFDGLMETLLALGNEREKRPNGDLAVNALLTAINDKRELRKQLEAIIIERNRYRTALEYISTYTVHSDVYKSVAFTALEDKANDGHKNRQGQA